MFPSGEKANHEIEIVITAPEESRA
jgi:hypothetical protein